MDNEIWNNIKKIIKSLFKIKRKLILLIIIIIVFFILLGLFDYYLDIDNGKNKTSDPANVAGAVMKNNSTAKLSLEEGKFSTTKTAQEVWDELIKNESDLNKYLKGPEELAKLIKAEVVTQYPDIRKNPDEPINWSEELKTDSNDISGIVKLNRTISGEKIDISEEEMKTLDKEYEEYKEDMERKIKEQKQKKSDNKKKNEDKELEKTMKKEEWMENKGFTSKNGKWQKDKTIRMTYIDPESFENKMKQYRKTGSEEDKKEAMKYFTLEKSNAPKPGKGIDKIQSLEKVLFIGDSFTAGLEKNEGQLNEKNKKKIEKSIFRAEIGKDANYWINNYSKISENKDVSAICVLLGVNNPNAAAMKKLISKLSSDYPEKNIYVQKVFPVGEKYKNAVEFNKKIEQYNYDIERYCDQKEKVFFIDTTFGYVDDKGFLEKSMSEPDGLHLKNNNKWLENIESNIIEVKEMTEINVDPKKGNDENKGNDKGTKGKSFNRKPNFQNQEAWKHPYNQYDYGQCTWFACGRFYEMYGLNGNFNGRGNGNQWVDTVTETYPDKFTKSNTPVPGAIFSGDAAHNHVGIIIDVQGDNLLIQEGNLDASANDFEWASTECTNIGSNPLNGDWWEREVTLSELKSNYGNVTFANPNDSLKPFENDVNYQPVPYYIKVATWTETQTELSGDDVEGKIVESAPVHEMTGTRINYYDMVRGYAMPFDYLWALMVITEDKDFVMGLADLVYNSTIEITVNDNKTITTTTENYKFDKMMDVFETAKIGIKDTSNNGDSNNKEDSKPDKPIYRPENGGYNIMEMSNITYDNNMVFNGSHYVVDKMVKLPKISENKIKNTEDNKVKYKEIIEKTKEEKEIKQKENHAKLVTVVTTNTVNAGVTRANTWIVDYTKGYRKEEKEEDSGDKDEIKRKDLNDNPKKMKYKNPDNKDPLNFRAELQGDVLSIESKYKEYTTNWTLKTTTHTDSTNFLETTPYVIEKTSKKRKTKKEIKDKKEFKYKEKNFVTLLLNNQKAYSNIFDADEWLFEILESNDSTKETMLDLTKYLLYRTINEDNWNVTEFDFSIFEPGKFNTIDENLSSGSASTDLISFIGAYEGNPHKVGEDYEIFFTPIDGCYNVGHGVVVKDNDGKVYYPSVIPNPQAGQIVPKSVYEKLFYNKIKGYIKDVDRALAKYGVTFKQHQHDATVSFLYNCGTNGGQYTDTIVSEYKKKGNQGFRDYTKQFVNTKSGYSQGLANRRLDEYELFKDGDYKRDH